MGNCCTQRGPPGSGELVGSLVFQHKCACCFGGSGRHRFVQAPRCFGSCFCGPRPPTFANDEEHRDKWERAMADGFDQLLEEVDDVVDATPKCCGCCTPLRSVQEYLVYTGWMQRARDALNKNGLTCDTCYFVTYHSNGQHGGHTQEHLYLRIFVLDDQAAGLPLVANEISPQAEWEAGRTKLLSSKAEYGASKV